MDGTPLPILHFPSPTQVVQALAALPRGATVATDADNTVWAGDVGDEVVLLAATPPHTPWLPGQADFAWYMGQMESNYPGGCRFAAELMARVNVHDAQGPVEAALRERVRPRRWLVRALREAMQRGVQVWLVSASPRPVVEVGARLFGLEGCSLIAVDCLGVDPARFAEPVPIGQGKVDAWTQLGLPPPDLAMGDSSWDLPLLGSARQGMLLTRACDDPTCDDERAPTP